MKKAILVVSFGTTYDDSREKTIGAIENRIKKYFTDCIVERAFTSSIVIKRLKDRGISIPNVSEALASFFSRGIKDIIIQPTHIIEGYEYEKIINMAECYKDKLNIVIGKPLLYNEIDYINTAEFIDNIFGEYKGAVVLMGHGSDHIADTAYSKLQGYIKSNVYIATVEGSIKIDDILDKIDDNNVLLSPFMIVCGDHAENDLSVEWKELLENKGYNTELLLKGLGEYAEIQNMYIEHIRGLV